MAFWFIESKRITCYWWWINSNFLSLYFSAWNAWIRKPSAFLKSKKIERGSHDEWIRTYYILFSFIYLQLQGFPEKTTDCQNIVSRYFLLFYLLITYHNWVYWNIFQFWETVDFLGKPYIRGQENLNRFHRFNLSRIK